MGCSSSKNGPFTTVPEYSSLGQAHASPIERTIPHSIRFLESCLIIWLSDETSNKFENEREQLRMLVYGLKTFNNVDGCIAFISNIQDEKVFLIISASHRIAERFHHLLHLEKIYIFDSRLINNEIHQTLKHAIFQSIDSLSKQLQEDIKLCEMDLMPIIVAPASSRELSFSSILTKQEASFLLPQILKEVIYRFKFESGSKDVLLNFCRVHYSNSTSQLCLINEFAKNYRPNKALWWLTNQGFISQILNRVQRTHEIDIVYKFGFFIKQTNIQLNRLHEENALLMKNISVVYRGKTVSSTELDILLENNCGGLLSFPNFLLASIEKKVAVDFVRRRLETHSERIGIIFEIFIDHTYFNEKNPFALLKDIDMNRDEICFHMSTVFRIKSIEKTTNDATVLWLVKLELVDDDDQLLLRLVAPARSEEMHANPVTYTGKVLIDMGEHRHVEQFLLGFLQDESIRSQPRRLVRVYNGLGALYAYTGEYNKALDYYQQSLQTSLIYLQPDHPDLAPIYKVIGDCHLNQNDTIHAIQDYEKAVELLKHSTQRISFEMNTDLQTLINKARQSNKDRK